MTALEAAGEDTNRWTFVNDLATTDQGDLIQHDEIALPGDREGWDYRTTVNSVQGAFQCGVLLHSFADIFIAWCALPDLHQSHQGSPTDRARPWWLEILEGPPRDKTTWRILVRSPKRAIPGSVRNLW